MRRFVTCLILLAFSFITTNCSSTPRAILPTPASLTSLDPIFTITPTARPMPSLTPTLIPTSTPVPMPIRAVRVDYGGFANYQATSNTLEQKLRQSGINLVALGAGRMDWTYFKWSGHEDRWSGDVQHSGIDYLALDVTRYKKWAQHVSVVVDVFAARYIQAHPESAAVTADGNKSPYLVSTMQLVDGEYGRELLSMLDYLSSNYPIDSISLTELSYRIDGYGSDDKAAYMAYSKRSDWPRQPNGRIAIDDPSIGEWRSYEVSRFVEKAAAIVHAHHVQLFMDVDVSWGNLQREASEYGQNYALMLKYADRIIVWDYFGLSGYKPEYTANIAAYLAKYGSERVILSFGMWSKNNTRLSADQLRLAMSAAMNSEIPNLWITPSQYLSDGHWRVLMDLWGKP